MTSTLANSKILAPVIAGRLSRLLWWSLALLGAVTAWAGAPTLLNFPVPYVNDMVWDATRARFFISSGTNILMMDPETARVEDTIAIGYIADRIAISDDGQYLYAAIGGAATILRYQVKGHVLDLQISLGQDSQGRRLMPSAMIVLPGQPESILIARGYWPAYEPLLFPVASTDVLIFDRDVPRPQTVSANVNALYVRPADKSIFGWGSGQMFAFAASASGVTQSWTAPISTYVDAPPTFVGSLAIDRGGVVFDLDAHAVAKSISVANGCMMATDSAGTSAYAAQGNNLGANLLQYSLATLQLSATADLGANQTNFLDACDSSSPIRTWGTDGIAIAAFQHSGGASILVFFHASSGLTPVIPPAPPTPVIDPSGEIRLPLPATNIVYDAARNLLWAGVSATSATLSNSVVSIDPTTGKVVDVINVGGEPDAMSITTDASRLYAALGNTPRVAVLDLNAKTVQQTFSVIDPTAPTVPYKAVGLAPVPDQADSVMVVRTSNITNYLSSFQIYTNGVPRPQRVDNYGNRVYAGDTASSYYATDTQTQFGGGTHTIYRLLAESDGIHFDRALNHISLGPDPHFYVSLLADGGNLFTSQGELWTADTSQLLGKFPDNGLPVGFSDQNRVAYVQVDGVKLFDVSTFQPVAVFPFPTPYSVLTMHAARVGQNTIAAALGGDILLIPWSSMQPWGSYCSSTFSSGGQAFPAAGGSGFVAITIPSDCPYTVSSNASWLTLAGQSNSATSRTIEYQVAANTAGSRSSTITIDGQNFTVEQQALSIPGLAFIGSMPHLAAQENWTTTFTLVNKDSSSAQARFSTFGEDGNPLALYLLNVQSPPAVGPFTATSIDRTLAPNSYTLLTTAGPRVPPVEVGSAQVAANGSVDGFAIFRFLPTAQEAIVPLETRDAPSYTLAFDNTNGVSLGVAIDNVSSSPANVFADVRDAGGTDIARFTFALPALGHTSFVLPLEFPITADKTGTITLYTPSGRRISVLGIRFTPPGTLTTIPVLANVNASGGSVPHIASGGGWKTTFVLANTSGEPANAHLKFFDDNGNPLFLPITAAQGGAATGSASTADFVVPAFGQVSLETSSPLASQALTGSAQFTTDQAVGGYVIFRYLPNGQEASTPFQNLFPQAYVIAFDHTGGMVTGTAINNASPKAMSVPVILRDDTGAQIGYGSLSLPGNGHTAFSLAAQFPVTANLRGTIEFDPPSQNQINVLGIRTPPTLTFTTLPALTR